MRFAPCKVNATLNLAFLGNGTVANDPNPHAGCGLRVHRLGHPMRALEGREETCLLCADPWGTGPLIYRDCATEDGPGDEGAGRMHAGAMKETWLAKIRRRYAGRFLAL